MATPSLHSAEPVDSWAEYPRPQGAGALSSIAFGNGTFVAIGANTTIITSTNGADWTLVADADVTSGPHRVRFVNDRFFAFAPGVTYMSADGSDWSVIGTSQPGGTVVGAVLRDVTFANGVYYGAIPGGELSISTNLVDWTTSASASGSADFITYANGRFVTTGGSPSTETFVSSDAQEWQNTFLTSLGVKTEITHQGGFFFTVRDHQMWIRDVFLFPVRSYILSYSSDGATWNNAFSVPTAGYLPPAKIAVGGPYYVFPSGTLLYYTTNLVSIGVTPTSDWTEVNLNLTSPENDTTDIAFGNDVFVIVLAAKSSNQIPSPA